MKKKGKNTAKQVRIKTKLSTKVVKNNGYKIQILYYGYF